MKRVLNSSLAAVCMAALSAQAGIVSISETGTDSGRFAIVEPSGSPNGTTFGEDAWMFTDRTHEYNGVAFDADGVLTTGSPNPIATIVGLPSYLVGHEYIAMANNHKDNANYTLTITVDEPSFIFLLLDNRIGDNVATDPPTLGNGVMDWVLSLGFAPVNTGLSPNGQPDYVGADEGGSLSGSMPEARTHLDTVGPGVGLNNFATVYARSVEAGSITLFEQNNGGGRNMYGVVVAPVPEPGTIGLVGLGLIGLLLLRSRRSR